MSKNLYSYGIHQRLRPIDLFVHVALDETQKQLGLDDLAAAAAVLLGQPDVPVSGKLAGTTGEAYFRLHEPRNERRRLLAKTTQGTSLLSLAGRKLLPAKVSAKLPMIVGAGLSGIRIALTRNLGAWVGRTLPIVGVILLATDAMLIMRNTVSAYNGLVKPSDRIF